MVPAPGAGGLNAAPGVPVELVLTGMGGAKPVGPGAPGVGPDTLESAHSKRQQARATSMDR